MADGAFPVLNRIAAVGLFEGLIPALVAVKTEGGGLPCEQAILVGAVRFVADQATLVVEHRVTDLSGVFALIVAGKTQVAAFGAQEVICLRSVRIVTRRALPFRNGLVDVFPVKVQILFFVAAGTELVSVILEDEFSHEAVP